MRLTIGTACSGIGGGEVAWMLTGIPNDIAWAVERADHQAAILERRGVPRVLRDVYDAGSHNLERVDVFMAGFPCQPFSVAGRRGGERDPRNLWPEIARMTEELKPRACVFENVPALRNPHPAGVVDESEDDVEMVEAGDALPGYLGTVLGDLVDLGYHVAWDGRSAANAGAWHRRDRVWIVAWHDVPDFDPFRPQDTILDAREIGTWDGNAWSKGDLFGRVPVVKWPRAGIVRGAVAFEVGTASDPSDRTPMWQTMTTVDEKGRGYTYPSGDHSRPFYSLTGQARQMFEVGTANEAGERSESSSTTPTVGGANHRTQYAQGGSPLPYQIDQALWQTPTVGNVMGGNKRRGGERGDEFLLPGQVEQAMWPTVRTSDTNGAGTHGNGGLDFRTVTREAMWPTARAEDSEQTGAHRGTPDAVGDLWPTAQASDAKDQASEEYHRRRADRGQLTTDAFNALWPTAAADDNRDRGGDVPSIHRRAELKKQLNLGMEAGLALRSKSGLLNPRWVEALMGYPPGWTDLDAGEMTDPRMVGFAWGAERYVVGDLEGTNPEYARHWLWHSILGDLAFPLAPREKQTKDRLISLGNAWVPQTAAPILARVAAAIGALAEVA